jgi:serine/threonine protein kinase/tetratricopeptide (TPR) repeat protein
MDSIVAHYRIIEKIGEGGMGVVYRAHDERLGRDVALKSLPLELLTDESARKRLIREARTASALNHPNICTIHDVGEAAGQNYIVMEYVKGDSLSQQIREGGLPVETVIRYGEQISDALAHAHEHGIVHRDLKSANIVITPDGRVKVLDFGLAKRDAVEGISGKTQSLQSQSGEDAMAGTLHYMAPEVFHGEAPDSRCDIWSLGVVLYEMAAGKRPFTGRTSYELTSAILHDSPPPMSAKIGPGLRAVIDRCLAKEPGQRYQRASEVRAALEMLQTGSAVFSTATAVTAPVPALTQTQSHRTSRIGGGIIGALLIVGLIVAGWMIAKKRWGFAAAPSIHSLAVLPLENLSGDPSQEYFADGMTEELTNKLAQISALRVISRTSVAQYKNSHKSLPEVAKELHVDAVVEGSVMRANDRVRITAQLIEASSDQHLWAKTYEREPQDVLTLQDEVAQAIADEVKVTLTPQEQARLSNSRAVNPAAHEAYLKGNYLKLGTVAQRQKAKEYFDEAIRIDPGYAPAYAGLADYYWSATELNPNAAMPKAKEDALKALALDPLLAHAHTALAAIHFYADWDWAGAEQEVRRALELNPNDSDGHRTYSYFLVLLGRNEEAFNEIRRAQELDPLSIATQITAGWVFYFARQYDQALDQCKRVLELDQNSAGGVDCLGLSYLAKGMYEQAIAATHRAVELSGDDPSRQVGLGRAYALAGRKAEASKIVADLRRQSGRTYVPPYIVATVYAALGQREEAFSWLDKAYSERDRYMAELKADCAFDSLRADPRFAQLLHRVGFPETQNGS